MDALKKGKDVADAEIASSLYHRAKGYSHPDTEIKVVSGKIVEVPIIRHYPPDTGAAMAWLKNRQPKYWRDKQIDVNLNSNTDNKLEIVRAVKPKET